MRRRAKGLEQKFNSMPIIVVTEKVKTSFCFLLLHVIKLQVQLHESNFISSFWEIRIMIETRRFSNVWTHTLSWFYALSCK